MAEVAVTSSPSAPSSLLSPGLEPPKDNRICSRRRATVEYFPALSTPLAPPCHAMKAGALLILKTVDALSSQMPGGLSNIFRDTMHIVFLLWEANFNHLLDPSLPRVFIRFQLLRIG